MFKNNFKSNFKNNFKSMTWNDMEPVISELTWWSGSLTRLAHLTLFRRAKSTIIRYISTFARYITGRLTTLLAILVGVAFIRLGGV